MSREKSADAMNEAVARISGLSKKFMSVTPTRRPAQESTESGSVTSAFGGVSMQTPDHKMPPKKADEPVDGTKEDDYDDESQPIEKKDKKKSQKESRYFNSFTGREESIDVNFSANEYVANLGQSTKKTTELLEHVGGSKKMVKSLLEATGISSMQDWNNLAGLEEMNVPDPRVGKTGDVPTNWNDMDNKMAAGLPGLKGKSLQAITPEEEEKALVGDDEEMTLGDAMDMLHAEGISEEDLWGAFLEEKGLTLDLFSQLVSEADESNDSDEIDAILNVEDMFYEWLSKAISNSLEEGVGDFVKKVASFFKRGGAPKRVPTGPVGKEIKGYHKVVKPTKDAARFSSDSKTKAAEAEKAAKAAAKPKKDAFAALDKPVTMPVGKATGHLSKYAKNETIIGKSFTIKSLADKKSKPPVGTDLTPKVDLDKPLWPKSKKESVEQDEEDMFEYECDEDGMPANESRMMELSRKYR
jgi:hypothetical protein